MRIRFYQPALDGSAAVVPFLPPPFRGRGYATGLVAALSQSLFDQGRICLLYTDAANPTSDGISERIGY
jgi:predicted GNAT family acetyltransferase